MQRSEVGTALMHVGRGRGAFRDRGALRNPRLACKATVLVPVAISSKPHSSCGVSGEVYGVWVVVCERVSCLGQ
jgi:hypothetical protein